MEPFNLRRTHPGDPRLGLLVREVGGANLSGDQSRISCNQSRTQFPSPDWDSLHRTCHDTMDALVLEIFLATFDPHGSPATTLSFYHGSEIPTA